MSSETPGYPPRLVVAAKLDSTHVIVGESGGLLAVYECYLSAVMPGCNAVETEDGTMYLDSDDEVLDEPVTT